MANDFFFFFNVGANVLLVYIYDVMPFLCVGQHQIVVRQRLLRWPDESIRADRCVEQQESRIAARRVRSAADGLQQLLLVSW